MTPPTEAVEQRSRTFVQQLPYTIALAGRCCAVISAAFSVAFSLVFSGADPKDFAKLAKVPVQMVLVLSTPSFFVITAFIAFYASIVSLVLSRN
ncbi:hypothetical protein RQP46_008500 [Phenoliferia psychrophenolica]